jgi:hypothetical protein
MRKALAAAALIAGSLVAFQAPVVTTVAAAELLPAKCVIWPAAQSDCRAAIRQAAADYRAGNETPLGRWANLRESVALHPVWWECDPNPGGKTLLTCHDWN